MALGADQPPVECDGNHDGNRRRNDKGDEGHAGDVCSEGVLARLDLRSEGRSDQNAADQDRGATDRGIDPKRTE
jgi:hypothetical protein